MSNQTDADIAALRTDITQLRADFAKIAGPTEESAVNGLADAIDKVQIPIEKAWTEAKRQAQSVGREMEHRPLAAALTAFGTGVLLGLILNGRRG